MTKKQVSVSLNSDVVNAIDRDRGDVSRSLYLRKLITEVVYKELNEVFAMETTLLKSLVIDGVPVDIRISNEKESKNLIAQFIYELLGADKE